ncbi:30S ribosomal protein S17 [Rhodobacteraceae bacterium THAF1]|uniref:30S ribosomal protein S17 n=1 Tax=Palleronia sp. THAF1 TaxID=2587842 RepID=UPI000F3B3A2D|nr:30S ribosomal protein S17 [Palleronia sp. THAF1]QFU07644.1 30S ribosomal protein S17 [Palleronia sp. THAF1]VDC23074.1 30S ribosomal protein S17 [Rhodobacteraceae bacterium THAF1]
MPKRILQGVVTSNQNEQTITVSVERRFTHPLMKKTIRKSKKYRAHDENNQFNVGDLVRIQECAPKSKTKVWEVMTQEMIEAYEAAREEAAKQQQIEDAQRHEEKEAAH